MKITVIGSGNMKNEYNSASYMVDNDILVDMPNGCCKYLFKMNINPKKINSVLITHFHGDHFFDIPFYLMMKADESNEKANIYCNKSGKRKLHRLLKIAFPHNVKEIHDKVYIKYSYNKSFSINSYQITKYLVKHGRMKQSYGYIFEKAKKKVGFTGDATMCENVEYMASVCDYLVCDCTLIKGTSEHMGIDYLKELASKYPNCKYLVGHMSNETRKSLKSKKINNVTILNDGDIINI